jgi:sugar phosphate isomerase/epimerase
MYNQLIIAPKEHSIEESVAFATANQAGLELPNFMYPKTLMNRQTELAQVAEALQDFTLPVSLHGPVFDVNPVSLDPELAETSRRRYEQAIECALTLNATHLVFHSQWTPIYTVSDCYKPWLDATVSFYQTLVERYVKETDLTIVIENFLDTSPHVLNDLVNAIGSPNVKACLDIGHVNLFSDLSPVDWLGRLGNNVAYIHAHNNFGQQDDHLPLAEGNLDMEVFLLHSSLSYQKLQLVVEVLTLEGIANSLETLKPFLNKQVSPLFSGANRQHYIL